MVTTTVRHIINLEKTIINRKTTDFTVNEEHFLKSSKDLKRISRGCIDDSTFFVVVIQNVIFWSNLRPKMYDIYVCITLKTIAIIF